MGHFLVLTIPVLTNPVRIDGQWSYRLSDHQSNDCRSLVFNFDVDGKKKYHCEKDWCCLITKRSRTQRQYCRFRKCLTVGMKISGNFLSSLSLFKSDLNEYSIEMNERKTEDLYKKLPGLLCGASAPGIHFGAVTCETCKVRDDLSDFCLKGWSRVSKGFFRRSIKENAPEGYFCSENNQCAIISISKIICRQYRFEKCLQIGMSIEGLARRLVFLPSCSLVQFLALEDNRICSKRSSVISDATRETLFCSSIRQLQNRSIAMASISDSVRIASMTKKRKVKSKQKKSKPKFFNDLISSNWFGIEAYSSMDEIDLEICLSMKQCVEQSIRHLPMLSE